MRTPGSRRTTSALVGLALLGTLAGPPGPAFAQGPVVDAAAASSAEAPPVGAAATYPQRGDRGRSVWSLQLKLVQAGLLRADYRTGYFGTRTLAAVRSLQRRYHQRATGRVSAATMSALARAVAAMTGPRTWYHSETIGSSADGRPIVAYRAGQPGQRVVVVTATMHGEEDFGQYVARGLLEGRPVRGVDLWVVPVLNPDGLAHDRRWVAHHVDLNRNFPHRFVVRANSGPRAASAVETRVVTRFLDRVDPRYLVSWHQPLDGVDSYAVKDRGLMHRLSAGLRLPVRRLDCHGSCHGTMTGWFNAHHPGAAITVEYGAHARSMTTMKGRDADAVLSAVGGHRG